MEKKRSVGVTIFGLLIVAGGIIALLYNFNFLRKMPVLEGVTSSSLKAFAITCNVLLFSSLIYGIGVLLLKGWARAMLIIINIAVLIVYPSSIFILKIPYVYLNKIAVAISLGFPLALLYFFTRPKVREQFK